MRLSARPRCATTHEAARVIVAPEYTLSGFRLTSGGFLFLLKGSRKDGEAIAALSVPESV